MASELSVHIWGALVFLPLFGLFLNCIVNQIRYSRLWYWSLFGLDRFHFYSDLFVIAYGVLPWPSGSFCLVRVNFGAV